MTAWAIISIERAYMGILETDGLDASIANATATTATIASADTANYTGATALAPVRIRIDSEVIHVTGITGTTIGMTRAAEGTTGAAHSVTGDVINRIRDVRLPYTNQVNTNPQTSTINVEGDNTRVVINQNLGLNGTVQFAQWDEDVMQYVMGVTPQTTNLQPDETKSFALDQGDYPLARLRVEAVARNFTTGANDSLRLEFFKVQIDPRPYFPGNVQQAQLSPMVFSWSATKTSTDLLGAAIPGITAPDEGFYRVAVMS